MVRDTRSDHRPKRPVAVGQLSKVRERLALGQGWRQLDAPDIRIFCGMDCSTSSSRSARPSAASILSRSSICGPTCRETKGPITRLPGWQSWQLLTRHRRRPQSRPFPLCRRRFQSCHPARSGCLRGSGDVAPSAPRTLVRGLSRVVFAAGLGYSARAGNMAPSNTWA